MEDTDTCVSPAAGEARKEEVSLSLSAGDRGMEGSSEELDCGVWNENDEDLCLDGVVTRMRGLTPV